jgi:hypothetical protein
MGGEMGEETSASGADGKKVKLEIKLKLPDVDAPGYIALQIEIARWRKRVQNYFALQLKLASADAASEEFAQYQDAVEGFWSEFCLFARQFIEEPADINAAQLQRLLSLKMVNQIFDVISGRCFSEESLPPLATSPSSSSGSPASP